MVAKWWQKWKTVKTEGRIIHHPSLTYFLCVTPMSHLAVTRWDVSAALCCSVVVQEGGATTALIICHFSFIFVSVLSLRWCMEDGTWCCGKEIRIFFLIIIYELSWISSANRHLMMVEMFPNEPRSCIVWGNWPLLRPPKENWFKVKCQICSPRALWIKLITTISVFSLEGSQGSVTWVCLPADPLPSPGCDTIPAGVAPGERWRAGEGLLPGPQLSSSMLGFTVGSLHLQFEESILNVCSYVLNSRLELPPCLESLGKILLGLSSGDSITLLVDFTVT